MTKGIVHYGGIHTRGIGMVWVAVGPKGVVATDFAVTKERFTSRLRGYGFHPQKDHRKVATQLGQARRYMSGSASALKAKIDWSAVGDFARKVLQETSRIPAGKTRSYGEMAVRIGHPGAGRAVGNALARNPFPLWVPCHRVIKSDGSLGGFGGSGQGVQRKEFLLKLERAL